MPSHRENYNRWRCAVVTIVAFAQSLMLGAADLGLVAAPELIGNPTEILREASATTAAAAIDRAENAFKKRDVASAEMILNSALQNDPYSIPLLVARGTLALANSDLPSASFCHRRAAALESRASQEPSLAVQQLGEQIASATADRKAKASVSRWEQLPANVTAPWPRDSTPNIASSRMPPATSSPIIAASVPTVNTLTPITRAEVSAVRPSAPAAPSPETDTAVRTELFSGKLVPAADSSDTNIINDPAGQWASNATASSIYSPRYGSEQAIGAPNVFLAGNAPEAWAPAQSGAGAAWLELTYTLVGPAQGVRVRQNSAPGCITRVEAIDGEGNVHLWWAGRDLYTAPRSPQIAWFIVEVSKTDYAVAKIRLTFDLSAVAGWKQIDAVQLVGAKQ